MKIPKMLWWIALLLFAATTINYTDRLTLSIVSVEIRREFRMDEAGYAQIVTIFLGAYAIMYAGSGYLVDRLGSKRGFGVFMFFWSMAQLLHGFATGKWTLAGCRFLLGLSEPGAWPAAAKAVSEWFPAERRALGMGIFNAGTSIGSAIAPPLIAFLAGRWGWRLTFMATGMAGLVWLVIWLILYDPPRKNRWLRAEEMPHVAEAPQAPAARPDWKKVIRMRECYTLIVARFFTDPVIYFVIFWLPEYLRKERGFDLAMVGRYAWVPFVFGGIAYVTGGWLSGRLMDQGWRLPKARKFGMLCGAVVMPVALLAPLVPTAGLALAAISFITVGHAFWTSNLQTLPADLFHPSEIGSATGFSGMGGAIGGMIANLGTGYVVTHYSYAPIFLLAGLMHPLSMALVFWLLPDRYFHIRR